MDRRALLTTVGTGISVGATGCLGFGSVFDESEQGGRDGDFPSSVDTDDGPATFEALGVNRPGSVQVREPFSIDVAIGNTGGESGMFEGGVVIQNDANGEPITIAETASRSIKSGGVEVFTLDEVTIPLAGTFDLMVEAYTTTVSEGEDYDASITVEAMEGDMGDPFQLTSWYRVTPMEIQFEEALRYRTQNTAGFGMSGERIALQSTVQNEIFAVVTVRIENSGTDTLTLGENNLGVGGVGQWVVEFPDGSLSDEVDLEQDPLLGMSVDPGSTVQGWLAYFVAREDVENLTMNAYRNAGTENPEGEWTLTDQESEIALPRFELQGMAVPERRQQSNDLFEYTVANTGDGAGTFRGATQWRESGTEQWYYLQGEQIAEIGAGESATVTAAPTENPGQTTYEYRFLPFDERFTVAPPMN